MAPRKVRAVTNLLKGKDVVYALNQMEFFMKRPVLPLTKLLNSAINNAENNFNMVRDNLYIKQFLVDEGIKLKRYRPKAQGRVGEIQKKTSRVKLVLDERVTGLKRKASDKKVQKEMKAVEKDNEKPDTKKYEVKTELGKKSDASGGFVRRLFRRKQV